MLNWIQRQSNLEVLDEVSESRNLIKAVEKRGGVKLAGNLLRQ